MVVFDGDPEKTTAIVMNYFRSRSYTPPECNLWKERRHFVNIRGKECVQIFVRLNIIGPPTEEQAAPQKVQFYIFT